MNKIEHHQLYSPIEEVSLILVSGAFDEAKAFLDEGDYRAISLEEEARLIMQNGLKKDLVNLTRDGIIYSSQGVLLTKDSPILKNAANATRAHLMGEDFYLTDKEFKEQLGTGYLTYSSNPRIPAKKFKEDPFTSFAFGKLAEDFGNFLSEMGYEDIFINFSRLLTSKPFVAPIRFIYTERQIGIGCEEFMHFNSLKKINLLGIRNHSTSEFETRLLNLKIQLRRQQQTSQFNS